MAHIRLTRPGDPGSDGPREQAALDRIYRAAIERAGHVAQIIQVMSRHPATAQASMQFYVELMKRETPLSKPRKELLATVVSHCNDCHY